MWLAYSPQGVPVGGKRIVERLKITLFFIHFIDYNI